MTVPSFSVVTVEKNGATLGVEVRFTESKAFSAAPENALLM